MKPIKNKKHIDPRYFLHEKMNIDPKTDADRRGREAAGLEAPDPNWRTEIGKNVPAEARSFMEKWFDALPTRFSAGTGKDRASGRAGGGIPRFLMQLAPGGWLADKALSAMEFLPGPEVKKALGKLMKLPDHELANLVNNTPGSRERAIRMVLATLNLTTDQGKQIINLLNVLFEGLSGLAGKGEPAGRSGRPSLDQIPKQNKP